MQGREASPSPPPMDIVNDGLGTDNHAGPSNADDGSSESSGSSEDEWQDLDELHQGVFKTAARDLLDERFLIDNFTWIQIIYLCV